MAAPRHAARLRATRTRRDLIPRRAGLVPLRSNHALRGSAPPSGVPRGWQTVGVTGGGSGARRALTCSCGLVFIQPQRAAIAARVPEVWAGLAVMVFPAPGKIRSLAIGLR